MVPVRHQQHRAQFGPLAGHLADHVVGVDPRLATGRLERDGQVERQREELRIGRRRSQHREVEFRPVKRRAQRRGGDERIDVAAQFSSGERIAFALARRGNMVERPITIQNGKHTGRARGEQRILALAVFAPAIEQHGDPASQLRPRRDHLTGADEGHRGVFNESTFARRDHQHLILRHEHAFAPAGKYRAAGIGPAADQRDRGEPGVPRIVGPRNHAEIGPILADVTQGLGFAIGAGFTAREIVTGKHGDVGQKLTAQGGGFLVLPRCGRQRIERQRCGKEPHNNSIHR